MVFQTKFESAHSYSEITKFCFDMERIEEYKVRSTDASDKALRAIAAIQSAKDEGSKVEYYYITSSKFTDVDKSKIGSIEGNGTKFFFYDLEQISQRLDRKQQDIPDTIYRQSFSLPLSNREILTFEFEGKTAVIAVSLVHMHDFVAQATDDLFASNVRQYLRGTKINRDIRTTIQDHPERFWLYNNGITIVCDDFHEENFSMKIQTPQIVNGCQTAKAVYDVLNKKREQERKATEGYVLVRIIKGANDEEKQNITRYTNTQNAVRGKDFYSLEQLQKQLKKDLDSHGYFYEIQRGAFAALKPSERAKYKIAPELSYLVDDGFRGLIPALEAIQAYTAGFKQLPGVAYGSPNELAPSGTWYKMVFDDQHEPDPKAFLYAFLVREWARKSNYSRGSEGSWRAHAALFFLFMPIL
jgi:hypothetical protein